MVELVNTNNLGLFDREIVQVQVLFPLVDLFYINPASFIPPEPPPRGRLAFSKGGVQGQAALIPKGCVAA